VLVKMVSVTAVVIAVIGLILAVIGIYLYSIENVTDKPQTSWGSLLVAAGFVLLVVAIFVAGLSS
jgi:cell division protein FtsX